MIDGNISMEEDTELRDLVVQTLENNGVLAKVRAELRASVFLTLEEQESVLNPEPFLNKSVKQYLASTEGKLLFSLVREFLEYFGLDYTLSVFDPETYFGKEYNYVGRKKLSEELGINSSKEPLLGEILKNTINGALNNTHKNDSSNIKLSNTSGTTENVANATFDISIPKMLHTDQGSISTESSEKLESLSNSNLQVPINVTITDKKQNQNSVKSKISNSPEVFNSYSNEVSDDKNNQNVTEDATDQSNKSVNETDINVNHKKLSSSQSETLRNPEASKSKKSLMEFQTVNNVKNKKQIDPHNIGKTVYFDEYIVDGKQEKITATRDDKSLLNELPTLPALASTNSSILDLPPLNGKKANMNTNMNDLKELMDIAQGVSQYDEDFTSSTSGSANEQSPSKVLDKSESHSKVQTNEPESIQNIQSENESEEIDEDIPSSISGIDNIAEKNTENASVSVVADRSE